MSGHILGNLADQPRCAKTADYFLERDCWVDARPKDCLVIPAAANLGWCVTLITLSHNTRPGYFGDLVSRPIILEPECFIAAFALLYNCTIGAGSIVACGSVVRSQIVPPWTMVEGNPARPFRKLVEGDWRPCDAKGLILES